MSKSPSHRFQRTRGDVHSPQINQIEGVNSFPNNRICPLVQYQELSQQRPTNIRSCQTKIIKKVDNILSENKIIQIHKNLEKQKQKRLQKFSQISNVISSLRRYESYSYQNKTQKINFGNGESQYALPLRNALSFEQSISDSFNLKDQTYQGHPSVQKSVVQSQKDVSSLFMKEISQCLKKLCEESNDNKENIKKVESNMQFLKRIVFKSVSLGESFENEQSNRKYIKQQLKNLKANLQFSTHSQIISSFEIQNQKFNHSLITKDELQQETTKINKYMEKIQKNCFQSIDSLNSKLNIERSIIFDSLQNKIKQNYESILQKFLLQTKESIKSLMYMIEKQKQKMVEIEEQNKIIISAFERTIDNIQQKLSQSKFSFPNNIDKQKLVSFISLQIESKLASQHFKLRKQIKGALNRIEKLQSQVLTSGVHPPIIKQHSLSTQVADSQNLSPPTEQHSGVLEFSFESPQKTVFAINEEIAKNRKQIQRIRQFGQSKQAKKKCLKSPNKPVMDFRSSK